VPVRAKVMGRFLFSSALCLALASCARVETKKEEPFNLRATTFSALPGWQGDDVAATLPAFQKSCARIKAQPPSDAVKLAGTIAEWQVVCAKLPADPAQARTYFEQNFTPYEIHGDDREGLFTGYYEPMLTSSPKAVVPLYARPSDMFTADLGSFIPDLTGKTITGRVEGEKFVPYYTREEIEKGAIKNTAKEVARVDSAVDAFFLHIQGSGQVKKADGTVQRVGYAAQNGQKYEAVGKELIARGELTKDNVSMQSIRAWMEKNPEQAQALMNTNKSYVFFREIGAEGPLGAEGVPLTPGRSLAVDRKRIPYGVPMFIDAEEPEGGPRLQRLMVAQDTGGAITGSVRGDFFWGAGDQAAHKAGLMKSKGYAWVLLPKGVTPDTKNPQP
jgi:membrane-bound lytic murein transglycosylase A